ncbi:MAG TPA: AAA family ATPase [Polyangiaceae bacterium]|nr:AAA family ATPase [Polyangiaceae bacterium]
MRFQSLDLVRFGPFSDLRLELGEPSPGLHVLYGPNEAGKSTTLRAIVGFLFGIPETTPDAHTHKMSDLRVGARLALPSGECLHLVRRKGRVSTLADAEGRPVDEAVVRAALGGLGREAFEAMFGLDHAGLRRGGDELLRAEGKVGESLYGAGLGAGVLGVLRKLEQRAATIFVPQGKNQALPRALRAYADAKKLVLERSLRPAEWHESADALGRALAERDEADAAFRALSARRDRTRRLATALPLLSRRAELGRERAALGPGPLLAEGAADERRRAQQTAREAAARHDSLARALGEIERQLEELAPPGPLLSRGELVEDLQGRLGAYRRAKGELPRLAAEASALDEGARALARSLGLALEALERAPAPGPASQARLRALGEERARLEARRRDGARSLEAKRARLDLEAQRLGDLPPAREGEGLRRSVERARRAGDLDGRLHAHEGELARLEGDLQRQANALGLVSAPAEDLAALPLPPAESCERAEREWHKFQQERDRLDAQLEELGDKLGELDARRGALEAGSPVPSEADLGEARRARDAGWQALRRRLLGPASSAPTPARPSLAPPAAAPPAGPGDLELADAFEADLRRADETGDRLRREADRVAELAALGAQREQVAQRRAESVRRRKALAAKFEACQARWRALWEPAGVASPLGPTEMRAWLGRHQRVADLTRQLEQAQATHAALLAQRRDLQRDLAEALGLLGAEAPAERGGLAPLLDHAEAALARLEALARERLELAQNVHALSAEVLELEREGSALEGELARWHEAWAAAVTSLGLGPDATTDEAALALDARNALAARLEELRAQGARRRELGAEVEAFERDAASLVAAAALDLAPLPPAEAAEALARRYRKACEDRARRRALAERRDGLLAQLDECRASRAIAALGLEALMRAAGCDDEAGLEAAEKRSARARELDAALAELEARLRELGEGSPIEALEAEAAGADGPSLRAELARLDAELERGGDRRAELDQLVGRLRERLRSMDGQAAAAEAAAEAQESLAQIQTLSDEYVTHALAALFLRQEIERHRERNQGPVLRRASELFRRLTLGAYRGLRADADERDEPVLRCLREGGAEVAVDALSDGTRDQLYLSLRLASIEGHVERQGPLPLAVDDILVHVDDERAAASLEALADLAARTQVLFFTHHRRLVDIAERVVPPELLATHWLDRARRRPEPARPPADLGDEGDHPRGPDAG